MCYIKKQFLKPLKIFVLLYRSFFIIIRPSSHNIKQNVCSENMKQIHLKKNHAEAQSQKNCFETLLKSHLSTNTHPSKFKRYPQNTLFQKNTSRGILLYIKRDLKVLNHKRLLFTVLKRSLLTLPEKSINQSINK